MDCFSLAALKFWVSVLTLAITNRQRLVMILAIPLLRVDREPGQQSYVIVRMNRNRKN